MDFSEKVIVLQLGRFKEADLWVRFLSPTRGLVSAFAFGGSRSRRRFVGCLDLFNEVLVRVNSEKTGRYLALQEGVLIKGLSRMRTDWNRLGLAMNCSRFLQCFGVGMDGAEKAHFLFHEILGVLEGETPPPHLLPMFFRARLVFDQGYALDTAECSVCSASLHHSGNARTFLHLQDGQILCQACYGKRGGSVLPLEPDALQVLDRIRLEPPSSWSEPILSSYGAKQCARAIDGFIQYHVGIRWHQGRFVRQ